MKLTMMLIVAAVSLILASPRLAADSPDYARARTRLVPTTFDEVELPDHASVDREAIVTVRGTFRTSCERAVRTHVESPDRHTHYVRAAAVKLVSLDEEAIACAQFESEYTEDISLGALDEGQHAVFFEREDGVGFALHQFSVAR